jgi:hypothetical protein
LPGRGGQERKTEPEGKSVLLEKEITFSDSNCLLELKRRVSFFKKELHKIN